MDNAVWATWYDLDEGDNSDYLGWLHEDYLPSLRARPGYAWSAHYKAGAKEGSGMGDVRQRLGRMDDPTVGTGTQCGNEVQLGGEIRRRHGLSPHGVGLVKPFWNRISL